MRVCPRCQTQTESIVCMRDGTPTVRMVGQQWPAHAAIGRVLGGRYRVTGELGRGGFGVVLEASHEQTGHLLAIKVLAETQDDDGPELAQRFFAEAAATSRLTHPNTVRVFDFGRTDDGLLYLAMERLTGQTLAARLQELAAQQQVMPEAETLEIADAVLRSLAEAHALGLVHRDLKPANIFLHRTVVDEVVVKVLDFGIVKQHDATLTQAGKSLGTPTHMSPEQALGGQVDRRSDLYALGVVLFECLTGQLPFRAETPIAMVLQHVTEPAPQLASKAPVAVSAHVAAAIDRALAKTADERWTDAQQMRLALRGTNAQPTATLPAIKQPAAPQRAQAAATAGPPAPAAQLHITPDQTTDRAPSVARRAPPPTKRSDYEVTPVVELEPAPSLGQRLQGVSRTPRPTKAQQPQSVPATPASLAREPAPHPAPALSLQATAMALFGDWRFAVWAEPSGVLYGVDLPALEEGSGPIAPLSLANQPGRVELGHHPAVVSCLTALQDGRTVASGCMDGTVRLWDIGQAELLGQLDVGEAVVSLCGSQDAKLLVAGLQDGAVALIDLPEIRLRRTLRGHAAAVSAVAAAGSRRLVVTADAEGTVRAWDPVGGGARLSHRGHSGPVSALLAAPDGATVWSAGWDGGVYAWQPRSGQRGWQVQPHKSVVAALAAGAGWLASGSDDRSIVVTDQMTGAELARRDGFSAGIKALSAAAVGGALAFLTWDGSVGCMRWPDRKTSPAKGSHDR